MTTALTYATRSARLDLPFLFAAQAQKEATVNEALARIDALLAPVIEGEASSPPIAPASGECWIVGAQPQDSWEEREGSIAFFSAGAWMFAMPQAGWQVFDKSSGTTLRWMDGWHALTLPAAPAGGAVIDGEARAAIVALVDSLRAAGLGT